MEQRPELRYALHVSPTAVSVAAERIRCMRCFHFTQRQVEANRIRVICRHKGNLDTGPVVPVVPFKDSDLRPRGENEMYSKL